MCGLAYYYALVHLVSYYTTGILYFWLFLDTRVSNRWDRILRDTRCLKWSDSIKIETFHRFVFYKFQNLHYHIHFLILLMKRFGSNSDVCKFRSTTEMCKFWSSIPNSTHTRRYLVFHFSFDADSVLIKSASFQFFHNKGNSVPLLHQGILCYFLKFIRFTS